MSKKRDGLNGQERAFAEAYAKSGNRRDAALRAGYTAPDMAASRNLQRPRVLEEIARLENERMTRDLLPAAVNCVEEILTNAKAPAGARIQAAKLVFDRTLGVQGALGDKEPHEMSGSELADAIAKLEAMAADRARPIDAEVIEDAPGQGIFD